MSERFEFDDITAFLNTGKGYSAGPLVTKDNLPINGWIPYRKVVATDMVRMDGPFCVQTREGFITCQDGFLAVDSGGWPYPIAADEHARIYVEV